LFGYAFASYFTWLGMLLPTEMALETNKLDFSAVMKHTFGEIGERGYALAVFISGYGAILSYITVVSGTTAGLLDSWSCKGGGCTVWNPLNLNILIPVFAILLLFLLLI